MRIKVGDKVRFLNEVGGGTIKRIIDRQLAEVMTEDGWPIPYQIADLVVVPADPAVEPYRAAQPIKPETISRESRKNRQERDNPSVFLLFSRMANTEDQMTHLKAHLINDSSWDLSFTFYWKGNQGIQLMERDILEPGVKMLVLESGTAELSDCRGFHVQGLLSKPEADEIPLMVNRFIPFQTKKFASPGAYLENDFLHEKALMFDLYLPDQINQINEVVTEKEHLNIALNRPKQYQSPQNTQPAREIDLHINQLVDSVIGLSNTQIIKIQLSKFEHELNHAIANHEREIIFIHGIGNGTLKDSLRQAIDTDYAVCSFEDASFKEYGFGATKVLIRQNK